MIILIMFLACDLLRNMMIKLSNIKISKLDWSGLWALQFIEGTMDDEVAAKLAIGEGRQLDLEKERLDFQALNSEKFRRQFIERNRPWILRHLVELITPSLT